MKKIIFSILILFFLFFLIGLLIPKNFLINKKEKNKSITSSTNQQQLLKEFQQNSWLSFTAEFQQKINEEVENITKGLIPDNNKTLIQYRQELSKVQEKFTPPLDQKDLSPELFINLAKELSQLRPPPMFYSFHLELIKTYYSIGLALKEVEETKDINKKILLYNYLKGLAEKMKF